MIMCINVHYYSLSELTLVSFSHILLCDLLANIEDGCLCDTSGSARRCPSGDI
jgi:hypothetical protein